MDYDRFLSNGSKRIRRSEIREILKHAQSPGVISFAGGLPAPDMFPVAQIKQIAGELLDRQGAGVLQYGQTEGNTHLKEELSKLLAKDGAVVPPERILIVTSSQQGLDIIGKLLLDAGDVVITSRPTYLGAIQSFTAMGAHLQGVEIDEEGTRTDLMEDVIRRFIDLGRKPKFIYENPDFQNPSGVTMSLRRRRELLRIAERFDLLIVEDSPYRALCFEGEPQPSILSLNGERGVSLFTFSKILAPAFRLGWMAGPAELIYKAVTIKQAADLCTSEFLQAIAAEFLGRGLLDGQIAKIKAAYRRKRDFMLCKLEEYMPPLPGLKWTHPRGGLFLWLMLPEYMDTIAMFPAALEKKVAYVVGKAFYPDGAGQNSMRINFSFATFEQIDEGIKRLAQLVRAEEAKRASASSADSQVESPVAE